jgi:hypothetical protein
MSAPERFPALLRGTYCLAQRPALPNRDLITLLHTKRRRDMRSQILVTLLVSRVFGDEMKVFATDDEGSVHLRRHNGSCKDTTTDGDFAGEGAFLVCKCRLVRSCSHPLPIASAHISEWWNHTNVCALNRGLRCPEAQPNVFVPSSSTLAYSCALRSLGLLVDKNMRLLLISALRLYCQFGSHVCGCSSAFDSTFVMAGG